MSTALTKSRSAPLLCLILSTPLLGQETDTAAQPEELFPYTGGLVIVGGGRTPDVVRRAFVELAGGTEGRLVVIPTASVHAEGPDAEEYYLEAWQAVGFKSLRLMHAPDRETAAGEPFLTALREATAVWFSGGDQAVLAERFLDTPVEAELQQLLERGGAIGGTSAGAAIQTRVMIANGKDVPVMARGFELLPRGIADQHFLARARQPRLRNAVRQNPGCVGWGIDERTALIVRREGLSILGESSVTQVFVDPRTKELVEQPHASGTGISWAAAVPAAVREWSNRASVDSGGVRNSGELEQPGR